MVHITEMRVPLPLTVEEFRRAQRYANWKTNESNTTEGQGGQLVSSAPYVSEVWGEGIFTHSLYRLGDRLPDWVTKLVPASALVIDEKTWMAYPHIRTVLTVPFFHKIKIEMISFHEDASGPSENILRLSDEELAIRKVDTVDISFDKVQKRDYQAKLDPQLLRSEKTGRGPLLRGWQTTAVPLMWAYKLVRVEANYWGFQNRLEKLMLNGVRQIVLLTHRNAFGYIDEWFDLTYEEIFASEKNERGRLKATVKQPPIIDPNTGQELVINKGDDDSVNSDDSEIDQEEFFEATMEWATQEAEEFGESLISGDKAPSTIWKRRNASFRCALCEARTKFTSQAEVLCRTCNELYCQNCFSEFHITPRLKDHVRDSLVAQESAESQKQPSWESVKTAVTNERSDPQTSRSRSLASVSKSPPKDEQRLKAEKPDRILKTQLSTGAEKIHQRYSSWVEELSSSNEAAPSEPHLSKAKSKSSTYRVLNTAPSFSVDNSQELTTLSSSGPAPLPARVPSRRRLNVQPNVLSEEMVRSISSIYRRQAKSLSPSSSSRSSALRLPLAKKRSLSSGGSEQQLERLMGEFTLDPYGVKESSDTGLYSKCAIVRDTPDVQMLKGSEEYKQFRAMVELLHLVNPREMTHEQRLAFWINVYNALMMHAYIVRGIPRSHYKRIALMHKCAYIIGGHLFSPLAVEHAILRACSYRPALASLLPVHKFKRHDSRHAFALDRPEPLISFALCCGSHSSPMVRIYTANGIRSELQDACREFLAASIEFTPHFRVVIPKIMQWYARDFSHDVRSLLEWIALQLPDERRLAVEECLEKRTNKSLRASHRISVVPYDWSFRYLFPSRQDS